MTNTMQDKPDEYWRQKLTPEQYRITREKGTEQPFTGKYVDNHEDGTYRCVACGQTLFTSDTKFESGSGWPSFTDPVNREHVVLHDDSSFGMHRTEVTCSNCGAHLGHVFDDGPVDKGGQRFCINSLSLDFEPGKTEATASEPS
ncbi:MAG: msrB [Candidatus Saccharibacteria bacterium]|nr:msrB [Candidatus Saccharibacteria bacterium]